MSAYSVPTLRIVLLGYVCANIRRISFSILLSILLTTPTAFASVQSLYIAQVSTGNGSGSSCTNATSSAFFNSSGNWGGGATQIGPGTTVHVCGTLTTAAGSTALAFQGSGLNGNPITVLFESNAVLQAPYFKPDGGGTGCGGAICMFGQSYVTVDGGTNGTIRNTDNGDLLGNNTISTLIDGYNCNHCTVRNLNLLNAVVKVTNGGSSAPGDQQRAITMSGSNWSLHDNVIDNCGWCVFQNFLDGDTNTQIYNNEISHFGHALMYATAGPNASSNYYLHDNYIHDSYNWVNTPGCDYHNDGLHTFTTGGGSMNGVYIYNNLFGGQWTKNTDGVSCATGFVFIESGGFSPSNASNVALWNNVGIIPSNSYANTNGWFGMFECRGGLCKVVNNTIVGPGGGTGGDNTLCLSMQKQTNLQYENNVITQCGDPVEISDSSVAAADYNLYGSSCQNGNNCFMWNGSFTGSFSSWTASCRCDSHAKQNNAPLINADGSLQSGSAAAGSGTNLMSLATANLLSLASATSKGGALTPVPRPSSASWDIGAYQGSSTAPAPPSITVSVGPASVSLVALQTQVFVATVTGSTNGVKWSIDPQVGAISSAGLYTAPSSITAQQTIVVTATSNDDSTKSGSVSMILNPPPPVVTVALNPTALNLPPGGRQQFAATVSGSSSGVGWSLSPKVGTISTNGLYWAPLAVNNKMTVRVTAASKVDPTKSATAAVTLMPPATPPPGDPVLTPTITQQPQSASVSVSQTATFAVTASGATSYQWQTQAPGSSTFTNVSGAIGAAYTTSAAQLADNGRQFRCVVSNSGGSVNSSAATLSVTSPVIQASGGSLSGAGDSATTPVNLTAEGGADWVHWGDNSLTRKAGVSAQISKYSVVGTVGPTPYFNDPRPSSWTDGAPTATSTNNLNGLYISGVQNGFLLTVPADTTTRTVAVHVGGWNSGGTLTARLSDGSAANFVDTTAIVGTQYDRNYALKYRAATSGQTLTVTWVMTSGNGNVTLDGAAISGTSISAAGGSPQSATVKAAFATPLKAMVKDGNGNPIGGVTVSFTAPGSGASAAFGNSTTATAVTSSSGVATAPALTANAQTGSYAVIATASGTAASTSFSLTNVAALTTGSLTGSGNSASTTVSLTTEGRADWVHWGDSPLNRKAGVAAQISNYTSVGSADPTTYHNDPRLSTWVDGAPTANSSNNTNGLFIGGLHNGFSFTAPADSTTRTLTVHVGGWNSGGTLTASLSDGSAANFVDANPVVGSQYDRNYTLVYRAASSGQTLTVTWVVTSGAGNVTMDGAALSVGQ